MAVRRDTPVGGLKAEINRLRHGRERETVNLEPGTAYEALTRQMVEGLRDELREIRGRINGLLFLIVGALGTEAVIRLAGF